MQSIFAECAGAILYHKGRRITPTWTTPRGFPRQSDGILRMIPPGDVANLQAAFAANPRDVGVGLYHPGTGEIRLGSFDRVT
jgi:hypothetical protein